MSAYDNLDALVDVDPIALRDEAFRLLAENERLREALTRVGTARCYCGLIATDALRQSDEGRGDG